MTSGRRRYDGRLRDEHARLTRRRILESAQRLLLADGYVAMTVGALAREAGVSVQTVYNAVGGKADIVSALYDVALTGADDTVEPAERPAFKARLAERDARSWFEQYAAFAAGIVARVAPLVTVLLAQAAAGDRRLAELAATIERERELGTRRVAESYASRFTLRPGLTVDRAADLLWTLTAPEVADRLIRRRGWSVEEYQRWLATAMADAVAGALPPSS